MEKITFKTKPQLAVQLFKEIVGKGQVPFKWILADSIWHSPQFIEAAEECSGLYYFVSVPSDTYWWLNAPITKIREYKYKGQIREKEVFDVARCGPREKSSNLPFTRRSEKEVAVSHLTIVVGLSTLVHKYANVFYGLCGKPVRIGWLAVYLIQLTPLDEYSNFV